MGRGSVPLGAYTLPVTLVVPFAGQPTCLRQRFVQVTGTLHTLGELIPQIFGVLHVPHWRSAPQPSLTGPQSLP